MKETSLSHQSATQIIQPAQDPAPLSLATPAGFWQRLSVRVRAWFEIPFGYEDENGFHYGPEPKPAGLTAPAPSESRQIFTDRASEAIRYASALAPKPEKATAPSQIHPAQSQTARS